MSDQTGIAALVAQVKAASENIGQADAAFARRLDSIEASVNEIHKRQQRPGAAEFVTKVDDDAVEFCKMRREINEPKINGAPSYTPSSHEVEEARIATKALRDLMRVTTVEGLGSMERKSLSAFSLGTNAFMLTPQMSSRVLSCIIEPTDVLSLFSSETTSSGAGIRFLIDNAQAIPAGWACDASCWANNPQPDLSEGLGELTIVPETLRMVVCVSNSLLEDASVNLENFILRKAEAGFRGVINTAVILGDGIGKPLGVLHPRAGIPICQTSETTPAGQFTWQDLAMLRYQLPMDWLARATFLMNQNTFALLQTMSTADGRPLWGNFGTANPGLGGVGSSTGQGPLPGPAFMGTPIQIVHQMPDAGPGATPIAIGAWRDVYMIVLRRGLSMRPDPYSAGGFCTIFRFETRIGGGLLCPNAARLLRIRGSMP